MIAKEQVKSSFYRSNKTNIRVYYKDTDCGGVVYYGKYAEFFEIGRTELLRANNCSAKKLTDDYHIIMPINKLFVEYKKPAYYDDNLVLETFLQEITAVRLECFYELKNEAGVLLCEGKSTNISVDFKGFKVKRLPEEVIRKLKG